MRVKTAVTSAQDEHRTRPVRTPFLDITVYHPFYSVVVSSPEGTDRFDHLLVSRYGVFVIESGSHGGWIRGDAESPHWTAVYANGARCRFPNPFLRDSLRFARLATALDVPADTVIPVIVFRGDSQLTGDLPDNVVKADPAPYIRSRTRAVFKEEEVAALRTCLRDMEKKAALFAGRLPRPDR